MPGLWWTEGGGDRALQCARGRFKASSSAQPPGRNVSWFEADGPDRWRVVEGRERGELLRAERAEDGTVEKLYFATYPLTRTPETFGLAVKKGKMSPAMKNIVATPM